MAKKAATATATLDLMSFAAPAKSAGKSDTKEIVTVDAGTAVMVDQYQEAKEAKQRAEGQMKAAEVVVKEAGRKWAIANLFAKGKQFTSFILSSPKTGLLYIVQDRFKMVTDDNVDAIREVVGAKNLTKEVKFELNPEVLAKHQQAIAKAIQAMDIPAADKGQLLLPKVVYTYGFELNDIPRIAQENNKTVDQVFEAVVPVQQLKTRDEK